MLSSSVAFMANSGGPSSNNDLTQYDNEASIKLILLGEANTGKTSLALRFTNDEFRPYTESTIGASFFEPTMIHEDAESHQKTKVTFKVWDTAGQEKYHALASMYYRGAEAAVVVFDISRTSSFSTLKRWVEELKEKGPPDIFMIVCGNKLDLEGSGDRQISTEEASEYATSIGASYIETSARDNTNVKELFELVAAKVPLVMDNTLNSNGTIHLGDRQARAGCCLRSS